MSPSAAGRGGVATATAIGAETGGSVTVVGGCLPSSALSVRTLSLRVSCVAGAGDDDDDAEAISGVGDRGRSGAAASTAVRADDCNVNGGEDTTRTGVVVTTGTAAAAAAAAAVDDGGAHADSEPDGRAGDCDDGIGIGSDADIDAAEPD
jgi:hypothetical protein